MNLWAVLGAFATSALLGLVKRTDTGITNSSLFRKLQPVVTLAGAFAAGALGAAGSPLADPATLTAAPLGTVAAVTVAELMQWFSKKWPVNIPNP